MLKCTSSQGVVMPNPFGLIAIGELGRRTGLGQLGAPLLRAAWLADTDRAGRGTTALRRLERRARGADSTLPGCRVHTSRGPSAVSGLGPQGSTMGPPRGI